MLSNFPFVIDDPGFEYQGETEEDSVYVWRTPTGDWLGVEYFAKPPDISTSLSDVTALRAGYRHVAEGAGLGVLEVEMVCVEGYPVVRTLFKAPQEPRGRTYVGCLTFPFRDLSLVLKVVCQETGTTGIRDAIVADRMMSAGTLTFDGPNGHARGWLSDPYDPAQEGPMTRNMSEIPELDAEFPDHPLSRVRWVLDRLQMVLRVDEELRAQAPFVGPG